MNKILRLVCRQADFKKIVSIGFFAAFLAVFLSAGTAQASFWDWINLNKANNTSQQQQAAAIANAETTYKWVNNGLVSESEGRYTGSCSIEGTSSNDYVCNSSTKGNKLYDGTDRGSSYGDTGHAWPIYKGENTSTAKKYTYDSGSCGLAKRTGGTVNEWECKSSDSSTNSSSSSSSSSSSTSVNHTATTGEVTNITSTSATLSGTVNPKGENVNYIFSYYKYVEGTETGTTLPLKYTSWKSAGSGSSDVSVTADISGLTAGATYKYWISAYSYKTKKYATGAVKSFTTSGGSSSSSSSSSSVQQYTLKVKIAGAGKITSSGGSGVVNCKKSIDSKGAGEISGDCTVKFNKGESVTLTPSTPSSQYEFATWAEACRSSQKLSSCTVIMNGNKTVSATFNKKSGSDENTATVSVRKTGKGSGKVISINYKGSAMAGINCGNDCSENFKQLCETSAEGIRDKTCGTVYFKAVAEKGSTFSGWGSDCLTFKNAKDQCYVNLEGDKTITANFNEGSGNKEGKYFDLTITVSEGGTVATTDNKISCDSGSSPCEHSYGKNGTVTLKVTPNSGYSFKDANISCSGNDNRDKGIRTCKVKMTKNQNVKINFKASGTTSSSSSSKTSSSSTSANHTATTGSATNVTSISATLNGTVNPKGENVSYIFSYGKKDTSSKTKNTSWKSAGSGSSDVSVSADISGLSSGTEYYYWLSAYSYTTKKYVNSINGEDGAAKTFTTSGGSSNSSSSSSSSSQTTASTYKLKVTISGNGRIQDSYSKIDCGSNMACEATYSKGQMIRIKTEDTDSTGASYNTKVESWSGGGCSGTNNSCDITMDEDKEVTVKFVSK